MSLRSDTEVTEREAALIAALNKINTAIFSKGAPLGSDTYFEIRRIACDSIRAAGGEIDPVST